MRNRLDNVTVRVRRRQKARNLAQGLLLLAAMASLVGLLAWLLFGREAVLWVLATGLILGLFRPRIPTRWLLAMHGARPLPRPLAPGMHRIVDELAHRAGLDRTPDVYYVSTQLPNALAVGRGADAAILVTDGLLRLLDRRQLVGVLAHEVSHIRNGDTTIMSLADLIGRLVHALATVAMWSVLLTLPLTLNLGPAPLVFSVTLIALPTLISLMQLSLARSREYDADLDGSSLTGDPEGLAQGLIALEQAQRQIRRRAHLPFAHLPEPELLRSHPSTADRVRRLRDLTSQRRPRATGRYASQLNIAL